MQFAALAQVEQPVGHDAHDRVLIVSGHVPLGHVRVHVLSAGSLRWSARQMMLGLHVLLAVAKNRPAGHAVQVVALVEQAAQGLAQGAQDPVVSSG